MTRSARRAALVLVLALAVEGAMYPQQPGPAPVRDKEQAQATTAAPSPAQVALASAEKDNKYLFIVFWKEENTATQGVRQTLDAALNVQPRALPYSSGERPGAAVPSRRRAQAAAEPCARGTRTGRAGGCS